MSLCHLSKMRFSAPITTVGTYSYITINYVVVTKDSNNLKPITFLPSLFNNLDNTFNV